MKFDISKVWYIVSNNLIFSFFVCDSIQNLWGSFLGEGLCTVDLAVHHETRLYNFDLRKLHFYIVKLRLTGVYIIFLISAQNIDCWYSLEPPRRGGSNEYPQSMF